nr:F-box domain-containing protein [Tanacetum cinerariifolium]
LVKEQSTQRGEGSKAEMAIIWNPTVRKSVGIDIPIPKAGYNLVVGFGVCPVSSDPKLVKISDISTRVWKTVYMGVPFKSGDFYSWFQVFVNGVIYVRAYDDISLAGVRKRHIRSPRRRTWKRYFCLMSRIRSFINNDDGAILQGNADEGGLVVGITGNLWHVGDAPVYFSARIMALFAVLQRSQHGEASTTSHSLVLSYGARCTVVNMKHNGHEETRQFDPSEWMASKFGKLDKFEGNDFRQWHKKMNFLITTLKVMHVLSTPMPELLEDDTLELVRRRSKWGNADYICRGPNRGCFWQEVPSCSTWLDYVGPLITDELDSKKRWSYRDPDGNVQGSFSLAQLRMWKDYFPSDLKIWSYYGNVKEIILLHSALKRRTKDAS